MIDDAVFEGNEVFSVNLFIIPGSEDPVVLGSTSTTSITIVENDCKLSVLHGAML